MTTLTFVAPEAVLPKFIEQIRADIDPREIESLNDTDLGIWETPEGKTYIDGIVYR